MLADASIHAGIGREDLCGMTTQLEMNPLVVFDRTPQSNELDGLSQFSPQFPEYPQSSIMIATWVPASAGMTS